MREIRKKTKIANEIIKNLCKLKICIQENTKVKYKTLILSRKLIFLWNLKSDFKVFYKYDFIVKFEIVNLGSNFYIRFTIKIIMYILIPSKCKIIIKSEYPTTKLTLFTWNVKLNVPCKLKVSLKVTVCNMFFEKYCISGCFEFVSKWIERKFRLKSLELPKKYNKISLRSSKVKMETFFF